MSESSNLRVADSEREQLAGELREHLLAGRLDAQEFELRLERAFKASTRAQLDAVREDLPMSPAALGQALDRRKAQLRRRLLQEGGGALGISAMCVAIWAASGADASFWPIWVILATLLPLVRNAWSLLGPAPDLEQLEARLRARGGDRHGRDRSRRRRRLPR